ncbi:hypothetical protein HPP92_028951 [Vanilla planifolia]|uniref:Uncharacterized protein n=1 Tax=Vanilla planifolia TaxID=51239 RepID=A0A835P465_VANPL|nr:hypothetical protein HPP92_028941 [Vanilla planifolia]KAG0446209.1 hypothetical protein HPP92_028951 [Vanilla planifolia]
MRIRFGKDDLALPYGWGAISILRLISKDLERRPARKARDLPNTQQTLFE